MMITNIKRRWLQVLTVWIALLLLPFSAVAIEWPQDVETKLGTLVVYQPQPESLDGNILMSRAAMSFEVEGQDDPVFGAFWFSARIDTDDDVALVRNIEVTEVRWPSSTAEDQQTFTDTVSEALATTSFEISMERLSASLENAEQVKRSLDNINNDAPEIVFSNNLSVLLSYDGEPQFSEIENSPYERVLNTPFAVARNTQTNKLYLSSGTFWYVADDPMGPWQVTLYPPEDLVSMVNTEDEAAKSTVNAPQIITTNEPTELVATDGSPNWQSLIDGKLLYVTNTETPWVRETSSGDMYVLLSGRWFKSKKQAGPWQFVRADKLPESFNDIPPESDIGGLRVSVAGTDEANQAVLDAQIPQTAAIKRDEATLEVEYDGEPKFEAVTGTSVSYAVNTATQVLLINQAYYAVDNGVWFTSKTAKGPWIVADNIPDEEIAKIPASSPVYNTTYVQVYDSTPEVVYVGYTPGYMWSYPYYGVPIYGTGWYYPPYRGRYYYPRPPTWGLHVGYNPWTGWNVGVSWSNGFFNAGVVWGGGYGYRRPCCGGYYGGGYRRPVVINTGRINIGNSISVGNRTKMHNHMRSNKLANNRARPNNLYHREVNRKRLASPSVANKHFNKAKVNKKRTNDVFADKHGNVARDNKGKWENRSDGKWNNVPSKAQGSKPSNVNKPSKGNSSSFPSTRPSSTTRPASNTRPANNTRPVTSTRPSTSIQPSRNQTSHSQPSRNQSSNMSHSINRTRSSSIDHQSLNRSRQARQSGMTREGRSRGR
ncbi:carbohydrate-binding family V/XII [Shewanella sp. 5_MG-2023]|uniref:carbohydrate-binding family V/XII n=1 Tax=Shewanella sp. 5_MG-2023 TaxID=3062656 RepID=UPI0026E2DA50|nr:carbohydrate-binding family V/XII [Shewanella sp. 5_MG-2023]MDO6640270.1 carbohydrate-binding family V/XII [Shewanella sp. 5_MG-2023]